MTGRLRRWLGPLAILVLNVWIVWRLFHTEYLDQLPSIEGAFLSFEQYIRHHWPAYDWFPLWYGGFPVSNVYQPALHYLVAVGSLVSGRSVPLVYHFVTALTYSLAGVGFYFLVRALGGCRRTSFAGAALYSLFSPSVLLLPAVRHNAGGIWGTRRLQAMLAYGEGPNITGLAIALFALALFWRAVETRSAGWSFVSAVVLAMVPATNWPATIALLLGLLCCMAAMSGRQLFRSLPRIFAIGITAAALASPFALPSTILSTAQNANRMSEVPTPGPLRWIIVAAVVLIVFALRKLFLRNHVPFGIRFSVIYLIVLLGVVMPAARDVRVLPQAMRFHVALEIPIMLTVVFLGQAVWRRWPRCGRPLAICLLLFCASQMYQFRKHARLLTQRLDMPASIEYREAAWLDRNAHGERVLAPGSVSFWMNVFAENSQLSGCCEQSIINPQNFIEAYVTAVGYRSDVESADYSLLWLKAWAAGAVAIGGPASQEVYKAFSFPWRFRGRLPLLWSSGDDYIYKVPERAPGLARVVRTQDLVRHPPANGIDVVELRPFVEALDSPALPLAAWRWTGANTASIESQMQPGQVVSVAVNYHPGWTATANGRPAAVRPDGLGLIVIEPECSGPCRMEMRWSPGMQPLLAWLAAFAAIAGNLVYYRRSRGVRPGA